ncbi:MAG TPA: LysM peptidoglycan-binding domain-containing protein [Clostridiales bacterium]|nr:LysM peptidoglycan-binding domain-containing protein [Clostridiales bacterium]
MSRRYILKNKVRFAIFLSTTFLLLSIVFFKTTVDGYKEKTYQEVKIKKGDTLWEIAKANKKGGDIRDFIYNIKEINELSDSIIYPGMVLKIPD